MKLFFYFLYSSFDDESSAVVKNVSNLSYYDSIIIMCININKFDL